MRKCIIKKGICVIPVVICGLVPLKTHHTNKPLNLARCRWFSHRLTQKPPRLSYRLVLIQVLIQVVI